jgi:thiol-disulfide isomerase/thioredoxin
MKIIVDEKSFESQIKLAPKALVFFFVDKGCSHCDIMKPIMDELAMAHDIMFYKCGDDLKTAKPDSITGKIVKSFPTFAAYVEGQLVGTQAGSMDAEKVLATFNPEKKQKKLEEATMLELMTDEANLIDQILPLKIHLANLQAEMARRRKMAL